MKKQIQLQNPILPLIKIAPRNEVNAQSRKHKKRLLTEQTSKKLFSEEELSDRWKVAIGTLQNWRVKDHGIPFVKIRNVARYRYEDVKKYERREDQDMDKELLSPRCMAKRWGKEFKWFRNWQSRQETMPYVKLWYIIRYRLEDVLEYERAQQIEIVTQHEEQKHDTIDKILSEYELAKRWRSSRIILRQWRRKGAVLPFFIKNNTAYYRIEDVLECEQNNGVKFGKGLLSQIELSERLGVTNETLQKWRRRKEGPTFVKISGLLRYRLEDVFEYEKRNMS